MDLLDGMEFENNRKKTRNPTVANMLTNESNYANNNALMGNTLIQNTSTLSVQDQQNQGGRHYGNRLQSMEQESLDNILTQTEYDNNEP